jgi:citrate synthase
VEAKYLSAVEAAEALGVSVQTFYVYVSRKRIPSHAVAGTRQRRYWKPDIDRIRNAQAPAPGAAAFDMHNSSEITFLTPERLYYRGQDVAELASTHTLEAAAGILWGFDPKALFTDDPPKQPPLYAVLDRATAGEGFVNRATALMPFLETANPRAFDLSTWGMARTGVDILRSLAAIAVGAPTASSEPVHAFIAQRLGLGAREADLLRRLLVLSADHGLEPGAFAVRATASAGVTPWRSVMAGVSATLGQRSRLAGRFAMNGLLEEIFAGGDPAAPVMQRLRDGEEIPGFESGFYAGPDPRAAAILSAYAEAYPDDVDQRRLAAAAAVVRDALGLELKFSLAWAFVGRRLGLEPDHGLLHVARSCGWVAHAMEQFHAADASAAGPATPRS